MAGTTEGLKALSPGTFPTQELEVGCNLEAESTSPSNKILPMSRSDRLHLCPPFLAKMAGTRRWVLPKSSMRLSLIP